jgi:2-amino-4-hydroxy-6-hydroxymethyldihydropteridine diphosphokinase
MAVELGSVLTPLHIFQNLKDIENKVGRIHNERWGPREIDLDLLYYDNEVLNDGKLCIPHPEIVNRRFVLVPMKEIAADFLDPMQKVSIMELLRRCPDVSEVFKFDRSIYQGAKVK